jgi:hypothetical protein
MERTKNRKRIDRHATRERIQKLLGDIEMRLESDSGKASISDYIRLLQLERELEEEEGPREIKVSWVERNEPAKSEA